MEQRVDNDRRSDAQREVESRPGRDVPGETANKAPLRGAVRRRRAAIAAGALAAIVLLIALLLWWLNAPTTNPPTTPSSMLARFRSAPRSRARSSTFR